jgi:hypothetical protein
LLNTAYKSVSRIQVCVVCVLLLWEEIEQ